MKTPKIRRADWDPNDEVCGRLTAAAARAIEDGAKAAGVTLEELVVVLKIAGHPDGENECSTIAYPADPMIAVVRMFNSACSMLEAATGAVVNLNFLPHEVQGRVRAMRASERRPSRNRGQRRRG